MNEPPVLKVTGLKKSFPKRKKLFQPKAWHWAVDGVSFEVARGQTLALVGESGSGKTTVGLMLLGLLAPTGGEIEFEGKPLSHFTRAERFALRRRMQVVFQDPYASLNARMNIREAILEGMIVHGIGEGREEREDRARELLRQVSLPPEYLDRYPHEFSGGQRQRIAIARALSVEPTCIVLDEPTSALDVSVQSQVLNLLKQLQQDRGLTYLFITHNLEVVGYFADEVAVMEQGKIIEHGSVDAIFDTPQMPYTQKLLGAIPKVEVAF